MLIGFHPARNAFSAAAPTETDRGSMSRSNVGFSGWLNRLCMRVLTGNAAASHRLALLRLEGRPGDWGVKDVARVCAARSAAL
jgi:hypothetical protein